MKLSSRKYLKICDAISSEHLRYKGHRRKANPYKKASASNIPHRTCISERPAEADGKRFGDWEMDLIIGRNGYQAILVLVERSPGYVIIHHLKHGKKAKELALTVSKLLLAYRAQGALPSRQTMVLNSHSINLLPECTKVSQCTSSTLMSHGKRPGGIHQQTDQAIYPQRI